MIGIALCDDDVKDLDRLKSQCERVIDELGIHGVTMRAFTEPDSLIAAIESGEAFDLLLCDVYMPGVLGAEAVRELREGGNELHVIFITSSSDHAYEAFGLHADGYIKKPYAYDELSELLEKSLAGIQAQRRAAIVIKSRNGVHRIRYDDFTFSESADHLQRIHLLDGSVVETRSTTKALFERLSDDERFFKLGSSFIVNLDNVRSVVDRQVRFVNGSEIMAPARARTALRDALFDYSFEIS